MTRKLDHFLWTERYRPTSLSECILPPRLSNQFSEIIEKGEISNMLFTGTSGIGKTTMARVIASQLELDVMTINCSLNGGIDTLRTQIQDFAMTRSIACKGKVIIMDESDYLTNATMASLRGFIENYSKNCRFIFTANYKNRIIEPLRSR